MRQEQEKELEPDRSQSLPLSGLKILEAATIIGGPMIAAVLSDYGADVIKVEDPGTGDPQRNVGPKKDGVPIWWQISGRNKRCVTLNLRHPKGQDIFKKLASEADVVVNGFRPGRIEKWGLGYEDLRKINPRIIMVHISGFGQTGPYAHRPGYGTLAEAMCGFAYTNGHADRPPCLPQMGLADSVAALYAMNAVLTAVYERDVKKSGLGQSIDVSLIEPLLTFNAQVTYYDQLGIIAQRSGSRTPEGGPRGTFQTADDQWVAFAGSSPSTAKRILNLVGGKALVEDERFVTNPGRVKHADALEEIIGAWIRARPIAEVLRAFEEADAPIAPVYNSKQILEDPQYIARETMTPMPHPVLGEIKVPNVVAKLSRTPGKIRWLGPDLGAHNDEVYGEQLGYSPEALQELKKDGVI